MISKMKRPLEVDAYTNPTFAPNGESPLAQYICPRSSAGRALDF